MGENSAIAWCDHTFNPWIGCQKVSAGCDHCYAETLMDTRYGRVEWGQRKTEDTKPRVGTRVRTSAANWKLPLRWAKAARSTGKRPRVFCASLSDWLDNQVPRSWRADLAELIEATPELDWLLLTKRPENYDHLSPWERHNVPANVWLGITAEDQENYARRWAILSRIFSARVRYVSYEPAIGPLTRLQLLPAAPIPDWIICGGESGPGYRDMNPDWARSVRNQCKGWIHPRFFMKQMAGLKPIPGDLMVRQFPVPR
jgi:protein gp37